MIKIRYALAERDVQKVCSVLLVIPYKTGKAQYVDVAQDRESISA